MVYYLNEGFFDKFKKKKEEAKEEKKTEWEQKTREERQNIYNGIMGIVRGVLSSIGRHKGIEIWKDSKEKELVLNGDNIMHLVGTDSYEFTGLDNPEIKSKEYKEYNEYVFKKLFPALESKLSKYGELDYDGDCNDWTPFIELK